MNKYAVAFAYIFDNDIKQEIVRADSELDAALTYLANIQGITFDNGEQEAFYNLESLICTCYEIDITISVIKIE